AYCYHRCELSWSLKFPPIKSAGGSRFCGAAYRTMLRIAGFTLHRARDTRPPAHARHARFARRVTLSHHFCIAEIAKSEIRSVPARFAARDVTANRHGT